MIIRGVPTNSNLRSFRERPGLIMGKTSNPVKPTVVTRGAFAGYSFPIFDNDDETLRFRCNVPRRWDSTTSPTITIVGYLDSGVTAGRDFNMQLSWYNTSGDNTDHVLSDATVDLSGNIDVPDGRNDQFQVYTIPFTIVKTDPAGADLTIGNVLAGRLRRIAVVAGGGVAEMEGEFVVIDLYISWPINQAFAMHT